MKASAELSFLTRDEALNTAESGMPVIISGDTAGSELIRKLRHHDPVERMTLDEETILSFERWIDQGAEWEEHWAFIPPWDK